MKSSGDNKSIGTVSIGMRTDHQNEILNAHKIIQTVYAFAVLVCSRGIQMKSDFHEVIWPWLYNLTIILAHEFTNKEIILLHNKPYRQYCELQFCKSISFEYRSH